MTATQSNAAWSSTPMANVPPVAIDYDYNCDGTEEKRYTDTFVSTNASCTLCGFGGIGGIKGIVDEPSAAGGFGGIGGFLNCCGTDGWTSSSPACGATGTFSNCGLSGSSCLRSSSSKKQECR
jgi:hypothetical protein